MSDLLSFELKNKGRGKIKVEINDEKQVSINVENGYKGFSILDAYEIADGIKKLVDNKLTIR